MEGIWPIPLNTLFIPIVPYNDVRYSHFMAQELYSVDQVAQRLGLHVRTVRNYVREGRLKAVRIGKQYRIAREDLEALTGRPLDAPLRETVRRVRHIEATSIVQIDAVSPELAYRITTGVTGAPKGRDTRDGPLRVDTVYDPERATLKVIITGSIANVTAMLPMIGVLAGN
jgi:excisionase family DNA binding protein